MNRRAYDPIKRSPSGSLPFMPEATLRALKHIKNRYGDKARATFMQNGEAQPGLERAGFEDNSDGSMRGP
jgi:hypothetical protein